MRTLFVVLPPPRCDLPPRIEQVLKPAHLQALIPQPSVKTFHPRVLRRLARLNVQQLDLPLHAPRQKMPARQLRPVVAANRLRHSALRHDLLPAPASLSGWQSSYPLPRPNTPACTHPPHSVPGSPVRTPPHRAQNPAPTPGSLKSAPAAAFPRARNASVSSAESSTLPPDTPDARACDSPPLPSGPTAHAAADTRSAASTAPTPPTACATAHRCAVVR